MPKTEKFTTLSLSGGSQAVIYEVYGDFYLETLKYQQPQQVMLALLEKYVTVDEVYLTREKIEQLRMADMIMITNALNAMVGELNTHIK